MQLSDTFPVRRKGVFVPLWLVVTMGVVVVAVAVSVVISARRRPYVVHPDVFFTLGLILALVGVVLMPTLGWEPALLTAVGAVMMLVGARRMFAGW